MGDFNWNWQLDGWITLTAVVCAVACSLVGNFLVLRRMSMLGDAITHAVLPGLAVAFVVTESRSSFPMFVGAVVVGLGTAFFTEWIRKSGRVDEGASLGVVFTTLFALGLVLIVHWIDRVDLDANCVLYGSIELTPLEQVNIFGIRMPRAFLILSAVLGLNTIVITLFYKELKIASFDSGLASSVGFSPATIHYVLMTLVAVTAVASFESVGSVLVVAMMIVPPATAFLLTRRLFQMLVVSALIAAISGILGHFSAISIPSWFGFRSTSTAGMMAVAAGSLFTLAAIFAPQDGIAIRMWHQILLGLNILADDIVALLYRVEEKQGRKEAESRWIREVLLCNRLAFIAVKRWLLFRGELRNNANQISLTELGHHRAQNLVRSHRLWEQYLLDEVGLDPSRIHPQAEKMEHYTDKDLREKLHQAIDNPDVDPHGSPIPVERSNRPKK